MAKVITLSRNFPSYHPKVGQRTYFVEQVLNALGIEWYDVGYLDLLHELNPQKPDLVWDFFCEILKTSDQPIQDDKLHTIRAGNRWKQGDKASLRIWSEKPYNSPQIIIAPDVELVKVYNFQTTRTDNGVWIDGSYKRPSRIPEISKNDGLTINDFKSWFSHPSNFEGQILCWKEVDYV